MRRPVQPLPAATTSPAARAVAQEVLEGEMTEFLGAAPSERTDGRQGYRAGYYGRNLVTRIGKLELRIGAHSHGQGLETTLAQVAHQILGIEIAKIAVVHGDTKLSKAEKDATTRPRFMPMGNWLPDAYLAAPSSATAGRSRGMWASRSSGQDR